MKMKPLRSGLTLGQRSTTLKFIIKKQEEKDMTKRENHNLHSNAFRK